ncbi:GNAT family N-acetyltransferase [Chitinolyticbacter meiyuanensis]|uniref:GNAT family N-acetyltransferase n=1 Tax=Chitinolyticbacter meiyuanensis TaxID=682798 RepID=UPI0011E58965|nr:GNAT family N-acetyltransferase [Chitinolyticbacter meiyuanensis]
MASLLAELGYPQANLAHMTTVLTRLHGPHDRLLLADSGSGLLGLIAIHLLPQLHAPGLLGKVTGLVVTADARGQGVGRALLDAAARFARSQGAVRIEIISGNHRPEAHAFYQHLGYQRTEQSRFLAQLVGKDGT